MDVLELTRRIDMPKEAMTSLKQVLPTLPDIDREVIRRLASSQSADEISAWHSLRHLLKPDADGWRMLAAMLGCAADATFRRYLDADIPQDVFIDTMACFSRFVREHKTSYATYGFDRDFWTYRQLGMRLFRLGTLEFELVEGTDVPAGIEGDKAVNVHIPSDADLGADTCDASLKREERFMARFFPTFCEVPVICESWLLSPALKRLLPQGSRILDFQRRFQLVSTNDEAEDWREWVFQRNPEPVDCLPERTSLQRSMKRWLMGGHRVGTGTGVLI